MARDVSDYTRVGPRINVAALLTWVGEDDQTATVEQWLTDLAGDKPAIAGLSTEAKQDEATDLYIGFRTWAAVYEFRLANPASRTVNDKGSTGYTDAQIAAAAFERDRYEGLLDDLLALAEDTEAETFRTLQSLRD